MKTNVMPKPALPRRGNAAGRRCATLAISAVILSAAMLAVGIEVASSADAAASDVSKAQPVAESTREAGAVKKSAEKPVEKTSEKPASKPAEKSAEKQPAKEAAGKDAVASLFDGKSLGKWKAADLSEHSEPGKIRVENGAILIEEGNPATGMRWTGDLPRSNYELRFEAKRIEGVDFFCGLTFPVGKDYLTLIVGGWGGRVIGLSNLDGKAAVANEMMRVRDLENDRWYAVRLRVDDAKIQMWLDSEQLIDLPRGKHRYTIWPVQEPMRPLGIMTWYTTAAVRKLELRRLEPTGEKTAGDKPAAKEQRRSQDAK